MPCIIPTIGSNTTKTDVVDALSIINKLNPLKYEKLKTYPTQPEGTWIFTDEEWDGVKNAKTPPYEGFSYSEEYGLIAQGRKRYS